MYTFFFLYILHYLLCAVEFHGPCNSSVSGGSENKKKEEEEKNVRAGWFDSREEREMCCTCIFYTLRYLFTAN